MGKQLKPGNIAPYRVYSLSEFYTLASKGLWPGANVEGIGFVNAARKIPAYIAVNNQPNYLVEMAKSIGGRAGLASYPTGLLDNYGKFGSITKYSPKGTFKYYKYYEPYKGGWRGGTIAGNATEIETLQLSGKTGLINKGGKLIGIVGISCSLVITVVDIRHGDNKGAFKNLIDATFGAVGFLGPIGFIISSAYFLIDPIGEKPRTDIHRAHESAPIDNLRTTKKTAEIYDPNRFKKIVIPTQSEVKPFNPWQ